MTSLITGCLGTALGYICCGSCNKCSENKYGPSSNLPYIFQFFIAGVFALVMSLYGEKKFLFGKYQICNEDTCAGNGSVYRVSFCLFIYELIHVIAIYAGAIELHWLFFPIKFLLFCGAVTATFFVHNANHFFNGWSEFARFVAGFYLLIQLLLLVTCAYDWSEWLQRKSKQKLIDNEEYDVNEDVITWCQSINWWFWFMLLSTIIVYGGTFTLLIFFYQWYGGPDCQKHDGLITSTIILVVLNVILTIARGNGTVLVSSIVAFYAMFLLFEGIQADPSKACNAFAFKKNTVSMWIGFMMTFVALFYAALRSSLIDNLGYREREDSDTKNDELLANSDGTELNMEPLDPKSKKEIKNNDNNNDNSEDNNNYKEYDERYVSSKRKQVNINDPIDEDDIDFDKPPKRSIQRKANTYFHLVLMLGSGYMAMLFTNWGTNSKSVNVVGNISLWVNMVCCWIVFLLFWWTLVMPLLCPSRFPDENDDEE